MRVLLAVDGSPHSRLAVAAVTDRPWPAGTVVEVLSVIHAAAPLALDPALVIAAIHMDQIADGRQASTAVIDFAVGELRKKAPDLTVTTKLVEGSPADVILEEAREWDADIVIVGSHGYGRLKRMVLGSVAGAVVANAHCSVLVAREKPHAQHAAA